LVVLVSFFCNDPAPPELHTLSLHDALPIFDVSGGRRVERHQAPQDVAIHALHALMIARELQIRVERRVAQILEQGTLVGVVHRQDRKSTRLNSSHVAISYAVLCLKKKKYR